MVGYVYDQAGSPLRGVKLEARSPTQIGGTKVAYSNEEGHFRFRELHPGQFEVTASLPKLRTLVIKGVQVRAGAQAEVSIVMEVLSAQTEEVKVVEKAPSVSTTATTIGGAYDRDFTGAPRVARAPSVESAIVAEAGAAVVGQGRAYALDGAAHAGVLTAGLWDDNLNFSFYLRYLRGPVAQWAAAPRIPREDRLVITVAASDGQPVAGAEVVVRTQAGSRFRTITGADGRALYFPAWQGVSPSTPVTASAALANRRASATVAAQAGALTLRLEGRGGKAPAGLDLAFMVDATGSMGDEIAYLQKEVQAIATSVERRFPGLSQRWALVIYRDVGDPVVVKTFDFTPRLEVFRRALAAQRAEGGGDYPEAPDQGLVAATSLSWRAGATARVLFWIADAPHHLGREDAMVEGLHAAVDRGVHIYPVAASGADDLTEYTMRSAAQVTGGRYLFLTDDSGVGLAHKEPRIPCYFVTSLAAAMKRVVTMELAGQYLEPVAEEILRSGGQPRRCQCRLASGEMVSAY
jgi:hypothetical protein